MSPILSLEATGPRAEELAMAAGEKRQIAVGFDPAVNSFTFDAAASPRTSWRRSSPTSSTRSSPSGARTCARSTELYSVEMFGSAWTRSGMIIRKCSGACAASSSTRSASSG